MMRFSWPSLVTYPFLLTTIGCADPEHGVTEFEASLSSVSVGEALVCGVQASGTSRCWRSLQLDDPQFLALDDPPWSSIVQIEVASAAFNLLHVVCVLGQTGSLACWNSQDGHWDLEVPEGPFASIYLNSRRVAGITPGGDVAYGYLPSTIFPEAPSDLDSPPDGLEFVDLSLGLDADCGVTVEGEVICWPVFETADPEPRQPSLSGPAEAMEGNGERGCALGVDGEMACWGDPALTPSPAGPFRAFTLSGSVACALSPRGDATCWGDDAYQRALWVQSAHSYALEVPDRRFQTLDGGSGVVCGAGRPEGNLICWGREHDQFGSPTSEGP